MINKIVQHALLLLIILLLLLVILCMALNTSHKLV